MRATKRELWWFRPELDQFSIHLSLTVFKYFLMTLKEFLQKQRELFLKYHTSPIMAKPTFFKCIIVG